MTSSSTSWWDRFGKRLFIGFCIFTLIGLFFSFRGAQGISGASLRLAFTRWYVWGALTPLIILMDGRFARLQSFTKRLLLHLPASVVGTVVFVIVFFIADYVLNGQAPVAVRMNSDFANSFQWNIQNYWLIAGVWMALDYYRESRNRELKALQLEGLLAQARLQSLRAQLQPHFLFNALNTISAFVEAEPKVARRMIEHLGDLLRLSLEHSSQQETSLEEELAALDHFLAIQRVRFEDRLRIVMAIEPETLHAAVPGLILQPLVENAIRHGAAQQRANCITVSASRANGSLQLSVIDNGPGLPSGWQLAEKAGIGLSNTQQRLAQLYPGEHQFNLRETPNGGVTAEIILPYREAQPQLNISNAEDSSHHN
ncbi:MAG TPA: histidine kinase [Pyrinomonadaceae bacterium]|nr:histidine kinase [Pyrinomonadaceae bacterium]